MKFVINRSRFQHRRITGIRPFGANQPFNRNGTEEVLELTQEQIDRMFQIEFKILQLRHKGLSWREIAAQLRLDITVARGRALLAIVHAVEPAMRRNSRRTGFIYRGVANQ